MTFKYGRARQPKIAREQPHTLSPCAWSPDRVPPLWSDPLLLGVFLLAGLFTAFQLGLTLLEPAWHSLVTDWLRAALAWPGLLGVVLMSLWFTRHHHPDALTWWMVSAGLLMYAIAQSLWALADQVTFPSRVPSPWWSDLFYLLQYPGFFLALLWLPHPPPGGQSGLTRVKVLLDCLLVLGAVTALCWYFLLEPLYLESGQSLFGKITTLAYPIGDLGLFFGLVLTLIYRRPVERRVLVLLLGAVVCLSLADSWSASITLHTVYVGGNYPDVFWMLCYLLFPLAGLVQVRLAQREWAIQLGSSLKGHTSAQGSLPGETILIGSLRFLLPFVLALLAGGIIVVQATVASDHSHSSLVPFAVAFGLLILVIARQELVFLESERWRREREVARAHELEALQEANRHMDTFLGMASHELKTPLAGMRLGLQATERNFKRLAQRTENLMTEFAPMLEGFARVRSQEARLERLVNELLDVTRIQTGKMEFHLEPADLVTIVREAVEEQRQVAPHRAIRLHLPTHQRVPLLADADRIRQVVTNYLTNALKYSQEDCPVEVGLELEAGVARVWVRDEGPGLPDEEQERIWERFHRAKGVEVRSGSGAGLGLGLHICRTIIAGHQGQVGVVSIPGVGSTFWFILPLGSQGL
jgi:signal transduction histidine kinase